MATLWNHKLLLASVIFVISAMCVEGMFGGTSMQFVKEIQGNSLKISLDFTAMDENGTAISGATLYCSESSGGTYSQLGTTTTDSQGKLSYTVTQHSSVSPDDCDALTSTKTMTLYCYAQKGDVKTTKVSDTLDLESICREMFPPTSTPTASSTSTTTSAPIATPTPTASAISPTSTPVTGGNPKGYHDSSTCTLTYGWACDTDNYNQAIDIHFYKDGPAGTGTFIGSANANLPREAAVGAECGGNSDHGFTFNTPDSLKDGVSHTIYVYALNIGAGTTNPLLGDSHRTITCAAAIPTPTPIV